MADQEQAKRRRGSDEADAPQDTADELAETSTEELDELLDEIDSVLEENAEEFVRNYVQKGGE